MRTTVTLDPDTRLLIERRMAERGVSFKHALNEAIRDGFARPETRDATAFRTPAKAMGRATVDLTKANLLAAQLEDAETLRVMRRQA